MQIKSHNRTERFDVLREVQMYLVVIYSQYSRDVICIIGGDRLLYLYTPPPSGVATGTSNSGRDGDGGIKIYSGGQANLSLIHGDEGVVVRGEESGRA